MMTYERLEVKVTERCVDRGFSRVQSQTASRRERLHFIWCSSIRRPITGRGGSSDNDGIKNQEKFRCDWNR